MMRGQFDVDKVDAQLRPVKTSIIRDVVMNRYIGRIEFPSGEVVEVPFTDKVTMTSDDLIWNIVLEVAAETEAHRLSMRLLGPEGLVTDEYCRERSRLRGEYIAKEEGTKEDEESRDKVS